MCASRKKETSESNEIKFQATVYKVQSLVDNGIRISLDLPEGATMQAAQLMEFQRFGVVLDFTAKQS